MPKRGVRPVLTPERIVEAAAAVADREGLPGVSMRAVGRELGVEAMSLYHHVAGKEALLDLLAGWIMERIEPPRPGEGWRDGMRRRSRSAREVMRAHPWGLGFVESRRAPNDALLRGHEAVLECLRADGMPVRLAAHAFSVLDAYVYGFVLTEQYLPFQEDGGAEALVAEMALPADRYPRMTELMREVVVGQDYDYGADEFEVGLELVLDALAARLDAERRGGADGPDEPADGTGGR
ncbi:TetR/AcrR family transcriptional regulator [Agrococcus carbonis]|uniref:Regulatory protein, tetR family n=1 Tax=Agrococcus carbonis TaxID=684552 RepID=A0A1H1M062_9MICO|nr:TetR/AcrR family transcriptional regulator [Agrococcus carbonis]SDR80193.1 regulatory protein, tetR family [Agrococcus carbonis]